MSQTRAAGDYKNSPALCLGGWTRFDSTRSDRIGKIYSLGRRLIICVLIGAASFVSFFRVRFRSRLFAGSLLLRAG